MMSIKMIKHEFLKNWQKLQIWERIKKENFKCRFLFCEQHFILTPLKGSENRFFFQYLVWFAPQN